MMSSGEVCVFILFTELGLQSIYLAVFEKADVEAANPTGGKAGIT